MKASFVLLFSLLSYAASQIPRGGAHPRIPFNRGVAEQPYVKLDLKQCFSDKYGKYTSVEDAKDACSVDSNCQSVYDYSCYNSLYSNFFLCPIGSSYRPSTQSCIHEKEDRCLVYVGVENQVAVDEGQHVESTEEESLEGCKQSCAERSECKSFAFCPRSPKSGCYMKDKILDATEVTAKNVHSCTTYYPKCDSEIALLNYKHKGKGYCRRGYYKGWTQDADHAIMDEEKCAKHCNEEPDCLYFAVKPLVTCSRYNKDAGNCESDKMSSTQHELSHELYKKNVCSVGELALRDTLECQLNGYTCTNGDGPRCCEGLQEESRSCIPCDETMHKKPNGMKYITAGNCDFETASSQDVEVIIDDDYVDPYYDYYAY